MKKSINPTAMKSLLSLTPDEVALIRTIGNDVGDRYIAYAAVDEAGNVLAEGRVRTNGPELQRLYAGLRPLRMVLETGTHSPWISRLLASLGHEVIVGNSREISAIHKSKKKCDRVDARTLAQLGQYNVKLLHPVHHRSEQVQRDLTTIRMRDILVGVRTKVINAIRGSVKTAGERLPSVTADAFAKKVRAFVPPDLKAVLTPLIDQVENITNEIRAYDKTIEERIDTTYPAAKILLKIRGVGPITALAYVLLVENPHRFDASRKVGAYFGLAPALDDSGASHPQMRISKQGDALMRRLLVGAAQYILGPFGEDCDLRRHGLAIAARGGKSAKKRAVVAVARKLAVVMHKLWMTNAAYDPLFNAKRRLPTTTAA